MSSDTGEALSNVEALKKAVRAARGKDDQQVIFIERSVKNGDSGFSKFKDVVFVGVVLFVGGVAWTQSISNAKLETTVQNLERTVSDLAQQVKDLNTRIKP